LGGGIRFCITPDICDPTNCVKPMKIEKDEWFEEERVELLK
jgi:hypothetical protein